MATDCSRSVKQNGESLGYGDGSAGFVTRTR